MFCETKGREGKGEENKKKGKRREKQKNEKINGNHCEPYFHIEKLGIKINWYKNLTFSIFLK